MASALDRLGTDSLDAATLRATIDVLQRAPTDERSPLPSTDALPATSAGATPVVDVLLSVALERGIDGASLAEIAGPDAPTWPMPALPTPPQVAVDAVVAQVMGSAVATCVAQLVDPVPATPTAAVSAFDALPAAGSLNIAELQSFSAALARAVDSAARATPASSTMTADAAHEASSAVSSTASSAARVNSLPGTQVEPASRSAAIARLDAAIDWLLAEVASGGARAQAVHTGLRNALVEDGAAHLLLAAIDRASGLYTDAAGDLHRECVDADAVPAAIELTTAHGGSLSQVDALTATLSDGISALLARVADATAAVSDALADLRFMLKDVALAAWHNDGVDPQLLMSWLTSAYLQDAAFVEPMAQLRSALGAVQQLSTTIDAWVNARADVADAADMDVAAQAADVARSVAQRLADDLALRQAQSLHADPSPLLSFSLDASGERFSAAEFALLIAGRAGERRSGERRSAHVDPDRHGDRPSVAADSPLSARVAASRHGGSDAVDGAPLATTAARWAGLTALMYLQATSTHALQPAQRAGTVPEQP